MAVRPRSLRLGRREGFGLAAGISLASSCERASPAQRAFHPADCGAEIHHRLGKIAGPVGRRHRGGQISDFVASLVNRAIDAMIAGNHSRDIGVDDGCSLAECDRRYCGSRIIAKARQFAQLNLGPREATQPRYLTGTGDEIAGPRVRAEACPFLQHLLVCRRGQRLDVRPSLDKSAKARLYRRYRRLLQHDLAQPDEVRIGRRKAGWAAPWQGTCVQVIVVEQPLHGVSLVDWLLGTTGGHAFAMAWSLEMAKSLRPESSEESPRRGKVRACGEVADTRRGAARACGDLVGDIAGMTFRRFGFVQAAIVSRWAEIVGERYAKASTPESIRFPAGKKSGGTLTLTVEGAHAPLMQHMAPLIIERVNRFFGHEAISKIAFRQGRAPKAAASPQRPAVVPIPKELGEGLREIADPELRACLESLAGKLAGSKGTPAVDNIPTTSIPIIRSK